MRKFSLKIFLISIFILGVLELVSFIAAFELDEGTLSESNVIAYSFARLYYILRFPIHTLFWSISINGGFVTFFGGLAINVLFYALLVERLHAWSRFKRTQTN